MTDRLVMAFGLRTAARLLLLRSRYDELGAQDLGDGVGDVETFTDWVLLREAERRAD